MNKLAFCYRAPKQKGMHISKLEKFVDKMPEQAMKPQMRFKMNLNPNYTKITTAEKNITNLKYKNEQEHEHIT